MESPSYDEVVSDPATCENLNNGHVYNFLVAIGPARTARELMSFERCPEGVDEYPLKNHASVIKRKYVKLQKASYEGGIGFENFQAFRTKPFEYPKPAELPQKRPDEFQKLGGDEDTFAKVALEIGKELHDVKNVSERDKKMAKRTIDDLKDQVAEVQSENQSLNDALASRNADYKRYCIVARMCLFLKTVSRLGGQ